MSCRRRRGGYRLALGASLAWLVALAGWPRAAVADETYTSFGLDIGFAARVAAGAETASDVEMSLSTGLLQLRKDGYRGYMVDFSYAAGEHLAFFSIMPRVEIALGRPRFSARVAERLASVWVPYVSVAAGYGEGSVWDTAYIEQWGSEDDVEVWISGVPVVGALGLRRIGVFSLRLELVGGAILVTSEEPDMPQGDAPSLIPSVGVRIAIGSDSFSYVWR